MKNSSVIGLLCLGLAAAAPAAAQSPAQLGQLVGLGIGLLTRGKAPAAKVVEIPVATETYQGQSFPRQRAAPAQLPQKKPEAVRAVEAELDRCHAALLASPTGPLFAAGQLNYLQKTLNDVATKLPDWPAQAYCQEAAFYVAADRRRTQPPAPAPTPSAAPPAPAPAAAPAAPTTP